MRPFAFSRADSAERAVALAASAGAGATAPAVAWPTQFLAGGTTLLDLMKLDVMRPTAVVDINRLGKAPQDGITATADGLRLDALVRMGDAAEHPHIRRDYPMVADALRLAASAQIRNMASLGGNVLQRTRCAYFRDISWSACNRRDPGSGCAAREGVNRMHAILGTSEACIATYPGDFAQALVALGASVEIAGGAGSRTMPFAKLHRLPGDTPHIETALAPGELITGFVLPAGAWTRRSLYLKIRDRASYEFALASAAVALDLAGDGTVRTARIALGGVATVPWRAPEAEAALQGRRLDEAAAGAAADAAFAGARSVEHNAYKVPLGKRTLVRALLQAASMEVPA